MSKHGIIFVVRVLLTMSAITSLLVATSISFGNSWSLSGDMQIISNPSPAISIGNVGSATWSYGNVNTSVSGNLVGVVNLEMPNEGTGWFNSANDHIAVIRFDVDANFVAPHGTGDDKTNFLAGTVGGHSPYDVTWTSVDAGGDVQVDWLGYNARSPITAQTHEIGRTSAMTLFHNGVSVGNYTLVGGEDDGYENRHENSNMLTIAPGDTIKLEVGGSEWNGIDLTITPLNPGVAPPDRTWGVDNSGNWHIDRNWTGGGAPNDNRKFAIFGDVISQDRVVYTEASVTVQTIQFANPYRYIVAGTGPINLDSGTGADTATVDVFLGNHEFQAPVKLLTDTNVTVAAGLKLQFNNLLDLKDNTLNKYGAGEVAVSNDLVSGSGGTLNVQDGLISGNGTIAGNIDNSGGTISPGNSTVVNGVPEPSSMLLFTLGGWLFCLAATAHRRLLF